MAEDKVMWKRFGEITKNIFSNHMLEHIRLLETVIELLEKSICPDKERLSDLDYLAQHTEQSIETIVLIGNLKYELAKENFMHDTAFGIDSEHTTSVCRHNKHLNQHAKTGKVGC
jgi:hypothetical protein